MVDGIVVASMDGVLLVALISVIRAEILSPVALTALVLSSCIIGRPITFTH